MIDAPHLDAMTTEELYAFVEQTRGLRPRKAARSLFGFANNGATRAARNLHHYAWNTITARACRLRGEIETARTYECIADRIYQDLPDFARW